MYLAGFLQNICYIKKGTNSGTYQRTKIPTVVTLKGRNSVNIAICELNRGDSESQSHPLQCGKLIVQL